VKLGAPGDGIVLTKELAKGLGAVQGLEGALLASDKDGSLNGENVHVAGTMTLSTPGDRKVGYVTLALAQRLLRMEGRASELVIAVRDVSKLRETKAALQAALGPGWEVHSWDELATFVKQTQANQDMVLSLVSWVFLVLMLLGVANTMLMSVIERTREVGTMMAVGVRRAKIVVLFLFEAAGIGVLGGAVGAVAGVGTTFLIDVAGIELKTPGQRLPYIMHPHVTPGYVGGIVLLAAVGAVLFALYPAWRASRLRPVEALAGQ
jgi:putative ABC transport system permease protein